MFDWLKRKCTLRGIVTYRGAIPPTARNFDRLVAGGIAVREEPPEEEEHWRLALSHSEWGEAVLSCPRGFVPIPESNIAVSWLSEADKTEVRLGESAIFVTMDSAGENVLRERKNLLRFLHAASGGDGVAIYDTVAQKIWSRADLEDEMRHDADLDVEGLYTIHAIMDSSMNAADDCDRTVWFHTHGLAELGLLDLDIVKPEPDVSGYQVTEIMRAIAASILKGDASLDSGPFTVGYPDADAELVDINDYLKNGRGYGADVLRGMFDDDGSAEDFNMDHLLRHAVVCEPGAGGLLKGLFGAKRSTPVRFPWVEDSVAMMYWSSDMTDLMAARARATYDIFREMTEEFRTFEFTVLAKLGYEVDGADDNRAREHLWFDVHEALDGEIDATLINEPFNIASMHEGDRGRYPVARFTDWTIFTPLGAINPRTFTAARKVREDPESALAALQGDVD